jgi:hypothetical protein
LASDILEKRVIIMGLYPQHRIMRGMVREDTATIGKLCLQDMDVFW